MSVAFWSVQLKAGKPVEVQPPEGYVLNLQLAALQGENEKCALVKVDTLAIEGDPLSAVVCTLRSRTADQVNVNLVFGYDVSTKFSFTGDKSSTVYLSGYYQPAPEDMGSDDEDEYPSDGESDSDGEAPAGEAKGKMVIKEDSEDSEDGDMEDDSVDEDFIKKMIQQNRGAADEDDSEDEEDDSEDEEESDEESEEEVPPAKVMKPTPSKPTPAKGVVPATQRPATTPQQTGNKNKNNTPQAKGSSGKQFVQQKSGDKRKR